MNILGIDYGKSKIGLALAAGSLAYPLETVRFSNLSEVLEKIRQLIKEEQVSLIVVGISEGEMGEEQFKFARQIEGELGIKVDTWDETLSTQDAISLAREAGLSQKKRKDLEDAFASAVMLQSYLDSKHGSTT